MAQLAAEPSYLKDRHLRGSAWDFAQDAERFKSARLFMATALRECAQ